MQDNELWVLLKEDAQKCGALLNACIGLCVLLAALVEPYMPSITAKVRAGHLRGCSTRNVDTKPISNSKYTLSREVIT